MFIALRDSSQVAFVYHFLDADDSIVFSGVASLFGMTVVYSQYITLPFNIYCSVPVHLFHFLHSASPQWRIGCSWLESHVLVKYSHIQTVWD